MKEKIREFLGRYFEERDVKDNDNIFELGLVNSLFAMQLVNFVEQEFDITVENEDLDLDNFKDINSILSLVESKMK
jgi:methoxymalonate biosynthesis acyl carrier protein